MNEVKGRIKDKRLTINKRYSFSGQLIDELTSLLSFYYPDYRTLVTLSLKPRDAERKDVDDEHKLSKNENVTLSKIDLPEIQVLLIVRNR